MTETLRDETEETKQSYESKYQLLKNLGLKEEGLEIHGGVSHNVHEDGRHVNCHENSQQSSSKNNLKWRN